MAYELFTIERRRLRAGGLPSGSIAVVVTVSEVGPIHFAAGPVASAHLLC